jgi:hypothetical protein
MDAVGQFQVAMGMSRRPISSEPGYTDYLLGVHVKGPGLDEQTRPRIVLTLLIDVSEYMSHERSFVDGRHLTRLDLVRHALVEAMPALSAGDIVNVITFDNMTKIEMEGAVYSESEPQRVPLQALSRRLQARLPARTADALALAYKVARRHHAPDRWSQIVLLTGRRMYPEGITHELVHEHLMAQGNRGIRLSVISTGGTYAEGNHREIVRRGKGSYFRVLTPYDVTHIMSRGLGALVGPAARRIRFRLDYPDTMEHTSPALVDWLPVRDVDLP